MSIVNGPKISTMVSAANGDTYGDGDRHELRTQQTLIQANVISMNLTTAPVLTSANNGFTYVQAGVGGLWSTGAINDIAYYAYDPQDGPSITPNIATGAWEFYTPVAGWQIFDNLTGGYWEFNGTAWVPVSTVKTAITVSAGTQTLVAASATPGAAANSFRVFLNNQATCVVTISNGSFDGQDVDVLWVQGGTTGTTVTVVATVKGFVTPSAGLNTVSSQKFTWDNTLGNWYAVGAGSQGM